MNVSDLVRVWPWPRSLYTVPGQVSCIYGFVNVRSGYLGQSRELHDGFVVRCKAEWGMAQACRLDGLESLLDGNEVHRLVKFLVGILAAVQLGAGGERIDQDKCRL